MDNLARIVALGPRWTGMEGDLRASELIAAELREAGREPEIDEIRPRPAYHLTHALHAALGAVGSVISVVGSEPLGLLIILIAMVSMYGDLTARFYMARYLMPRRRAYNITARGGRPDAVARVVLTANHDAARTGLLYWRPRRRRPGRTRRRRLSALIGPVDLCFWTLAAALVAAAVRLITATDSTAMSVVQFALTVVLMTYVVLFIDVAMSPPSAGASANASGVAALLEVGPRLVRDPLDALDVWMVFPAAQEGFMLGMREWMKAHAEELDPRRTFFVHVDSIGAGSVHHVSGEGFALIYRHDASLMRICAALGSQPRVWRTGTDGVIPAMQGFPSVTLCGADDRGRVPNHRMTSDTLENIDADALEEAVDFVEELVRRIDDIAARRVAADQPSTPKTEPGVL